MSVTETKIFFKNMKGFPELNENNKIRTDLFLEAAKEIVSIIESFGTIFSPVVSDMNGNIQKLHTSYQSNIEEHYYLDSLIKNNTGCGGISLLWLKRALELLLKFFTYILNGESTTENLQYYFKLAYNDTLCQYHGFIVRSLFMTAVHWLPTKSQLLGIGQIYDENIKTMPSFLRSMQSNLEQCDELLKSINIK